MGILWVWNLQERTGVPLWRSDHICEYPDRGDVCTIAESDNGDLCVVWTIRASFNTVPLQVRPGIMKWAAPIWVPTSWFVVSVRMTAHYGSALIAADLPAIATARSRLIANRQADWLVTTSGRLWKTGMAISSWELSAQVYRYWTPTPRNLRPQQGKQRFGMWLHFFPLFRYQREHHHRSRLRIFQSNAVTHKITNYHKPVVARISQAPQWIRFYCDTRGLIWSATASGLNVYDRQTDQLSVINLQAKTDNTDVCAITEDRQGMIWSHHQTPLAASGWETWTANGTSLSTVSAKLTVCKVANTTCALSWSLPRGTWLWAVSMASTSSRLCS